MTDSSTIKSKLKLTKRKSQHNSDFTLIGSINNTTINKKKISTINKKNKKLITDTPQNIKYQINTTDSCTPTKHNKKLITDTTDSEQSVEPKQQQQQQQQQIPLPTKHNKKNKFFKYKFIESYGDNDIQQNNIIKKIIRTTNIPTQPIVPAQPIVPMPIVPIVSMPIVPIVPIISGPVKIENNNLVIIDLIYYLIITIDVLNILIKNFFLLIQEKIFGKDNNFIVCFRSTIVFVWNYIRAKIYFYIYKKN